MRVSPLREQRSSEVEASVLELNKLQVSIGELRMFLASLSQDGFEKIPLGNLLIATRAFVTREDDARQSPPPSQVGLEADS
jgi:hypothetical protein